MHHADRAVRKEVMQSAHGDAFDLNARPFGSVFTAIAERAGNGALKNDAYTSFMAAKSSMSAKKTVVFTTLSSVKPASDSTWVRFVSERCVSSWIPPGTNSPVAGSTGSCPLT